MDGQKSLVSGQDYVNEYRRAKGVLSLVERLQRKALHELVGFLYYGPSRRIWLSGMRILHVFDHSLPLQSGYVTRSLAILRSQNARGWQTLHLTAPRHGAWNGGTEPLTTDDGLRFLRTNGPRVSIPFLRELSEMHTLRRRIAGLVAEERPDILHVHSPVLNALPALSVARRFDVPLVYEVRALWEDAAVNLGRSSDQGVRYRLSRRLETQAMRRADAVIAICDPLRDEIIGRGIPERRVTVVPNAVDPVFLDVRATDPELKRSLGLERATVLGFIGSFYAYEGLDLLLQGLAALRRQRSDLAVLLVGSGPEEQRLREMTKALSLDDCVKFTGRVSQDDVRLYYPLIDLLVFPRRRIRLTQLVTPLKPLEAMAQKRPLIASDIGGHRELVRHRETGYLFPPDDASALAEAIAEALRDPQLLRMMVEKGRRFVEEERNWLAVCETYATVYERLCAAKPQKALPAVRSGLPTPGKYRTF